LKAVARSPSGKTLHALRVTFGNFQSMRACALTRSNAFPELTTLDLHRPYSSRAKPKDTAAFLANLATPKLRHLVLDGCDFDDACAAALASNPNLSGLTRLVIERGTMGPAGAERLFRSANLRRLLVLEVRHCPIGKAAAVLADEGVMPDLVAGWLTDCSVPPRQAKALGRRSTIRTYD
jgi:hypothetical protein